MYGKSLGDDGGRVSRNSSAVPRKAPRSGVFAVGLGGPADWEPLFFDTASAGGGKDANLGPAAASVRSAISGEPGGAPGRAQAANT